MDSQTTSEEEAIDLTHKRNPRDEVVTIDDLVRILPASRSSIWKIVSNGEIPSYKIGRRRYVRLDEALAWFERQRYDPAEDDED